MHFTERDFTQWDFTERDFTQNCFTQHNFKQDFRQQYFPQHEACGSDRPNTNMTSLQMLPSSLTTFHLSVSLPLLSHSILPALPPCTFCTPNQPQQRAAVQYIWGAALMVQLSLQTTSRPFDPPRPVLPQSRASPPLSSLSPPQDVDLSGETRWSSPPSDDDDPEPQFKSQGVELKGGCG